MTEVALTRFVTDPPPLPEDVRAAGRRSLLNMVGCAIGGAGEAAVDHLAALLPAFGGPATCTLIGRRERADALWAAHINAAAANIFDYDDTHIPTVIHPSAPVGAAVLALAELRPVSGAALLEAFVLGVEVTCRLGLALHPGHYTRGWHITSTCGAFGAALACGRLLGLTAAQMVDALGHALAQNGGSVETLGTMSKSLSVGQAARAGLMGALLAEQGFTGPAAPLSGERGFLRLHSDAPDTDALTGDLGTRWEILKNTFKPYPCGVVLNPVLEACLALHAKGIKGEIAAVELTGPPLLRQRTDRPGVTSGRQSQVSAQHGVAVALLKGRADLWAFSDAAVALPELRALGPKLSFRDNPARSVESAEVRVTLTDGRVLSQRVEAAKGGLTHPMSDDNLADKLCGQIAWRGLPFQAAALIHALTDIENAPDAATFLSLTRAE
ncbi:MmgE/PrpD family protein [Neotabrizicola sp. VNH66]|uniref:MmgE/PrpD family protein n=1 Tax=Neotabrizicola sp. VNH66 TaxID=3400918 RepID=UPI003C0FFE30